MFRSFNAENFGSVGQRAAKLLAVKVGLLKKKSAASAIPAKVCASAIGPGVLEPGPIALAHTSAGMAEAADFFLRSPTLTASNSVAL